MYEGQEPNVTTVEKVIKWPECKDMSEMKRFLEMVDTVRNWIKGFVEVIDPLTKLIRITKSKFSQGKEQRLAMEEIKTKVFIYEVI